MNYAELLAAPGSKTQSAPASAPEAGEQSCSKCGDTLPNGKYCKGVGCPLNPAIAARTAAANAADHSSAIWSAIENYAHASAVYAYGTVRDDAAQQRQAKAEARAELEALLADRMPAEKAAVQVLKGVGKINGDGWKDVTRKDEVVFVWNTELPRPYKAGQYPRIGNNCGCSASTDQYDFQPAAAEEARDAIEAIIDSHRAPAADAGGRDE